jgi:hypothetical protein
VEDYKVASFGRTSGRRPVSILLAGSAKLRLTYTSIIQEIPIVIWESSYWKNDLGERAAWLRKRLSQKRWLEASFARLEQSVMLGFYSIRKLIEARKLSDATISHQVSLATYPWAGKPVTLLNWHKLGELYDLDACQPITRDVRFLCNQFIHSYVFLPVFDDNELLHGLFIASDHERNRTVYEIAVLQIINLFELIGNDYPNQIQFQFNQDKQDYDVSARRHVGEGWA